MKHIIIYRGLTVAVLLMVASVAQAEITGINDVSECTPVIDDKAQLFSALADLNSQTAQKYFQPDKNRFLFCMDNVDKARIKSQTILSNTSQYSIVIYGLGLDSTQKNAGGTYIVPTGTSLLTTTGPILLQNLTATNLRGPIVLNGAASMKDSVLSCDTTSGNVYTNAILELKGAGEKISTTSVTNCQSGISVTGLGNTLTDVAVVFDKVAAGSADDGIMGVMLGTGNILTASALGKTTISGFATALEMQSSTQASKVQVSGPVMMNESSKLSGSTITGTIHVSGSNVLISKSTLAGDPAVAITKGLTGVTVTQNIYSFKSDASGTTIAYVDPAEVKLNTMFDAGWMATELSGTDPNNNARRLIGKLTDQNSSTTSVEFYMYNTGNNANECLYSLSCPVGTAADEICFSDGNDAGKKCIHKGEKVFDCSKESIGKDFQVPPKSFVRFLSNTPTVSVMSNQVEVSSLPKVTFITPAGAFTPETVQLAGGGESSPAVQNDIPGGQNNTGGSDASIPDNAPMIGEAEKESGGGSSMTGGAMVLGGDAAPAAAGPAAGCGGQMMPGVPAAPGVMFWWLAPVAVVWYRRKMM